MIVRNELRNERSAGLEPAYSSYGAAAAATTTGIRDRLFLDQQRYVVFVFLCCLHIRGHSLRIFKAVYTSTTVLWERLRIC